MTRRERRALRAQLVATGTPDLDAERMIRALDAGGATEGEIAALLACDGDTEYCGDRRARRALRGAP